MFFFQQSIFFLSFPSCWYDIRKIISTAKTIFFSYSLKNDFYNSFFVKIQLKYDIAFHRAYNTKLKIKTYNSCNLHIELITPHKSLICEDSNICPFSTKEGREKPHPNVIELRILLYLFASFYFVKVLFF